MRTLTKEELKNTPLSNIQIELLTLFQANVDDETLQEVRKLLKDFFAQRTKMAAESVWQEQQLSNDDLDQMLAGEA